MHVPQLGRESLEQRFQFVVTKTLDLSIPIGQALPDGMDQNHWLALVPPCSNPVETRHIRESTFGECHCPFDAS